MAFKKNPENPEEAQEVQAETGAEQPETGLFSGAARRRAAQEALQDYAEYRELDSRGRSVTRRVYVGKYYEPVIDKRRRVLLRLVYLVCFAAAAFFYFRSAMVTVFANTTPAATLLQAAGFAVLLWLVYVLLFYLPQTGKLTRSDYKSLHQPLIRSSAVLAAVQVCSAVSQTVSLAWDSRQWAVTLGCAAMSLLSAGAAAVIWRLESHLRYNELENDAAVPAGTANKA